MSSHRRIFLHLKPTNNKFLSVSRSGSRRGISNGSKLTRRTSMTWYDQPSPCLNNATSLPRQRDVSASTLTKNGSAEMLPRREVHERKDLEAQHGRACDPCQKPQREQASRS